MRSLELCSGTAAISNQLAIMGWKVFTLDLNKRWRADFICDVRGFTWKGEKLDLIWAAPPCREFSQTPWSNVLKPDMSILEGCLKVIRDAAPKFWVIENVRGAVKWFTPYLGYPRWINHPWYLWGDFPNIEYLKLQANKHTDIIRTSWKRARTPYKLAWAIGYHIEHDLPLL